MVSVVIPCHVRVFSSELNKFLFLVVVVVFAGVVDAIVLLLLLLLLS